MDARQTARRFGLLVVIAFCAVDPWGWDHYGPLRWGAASVLTGLLVGIIAGEGLVLWRSLALHERWGTAVLGGALLASVAFSPDRLHALIGTPDRHFGALTWIGCLALFVAMRSVDVDLEALGRVAAAVSIALGCWVTLELIGVGFFASDFAAGRAGGPFSQPAYLGAAGVLITPLGISVGFSGGRRERVLAVVAAFAGFVAIAGSGSRAAAVGLAAALLIGVALSRRAVRRGHLAAGAGVAVVVTIISPLGDRLWSTVTSSAPWESRLDEWVVGMRAWSSSAGRLLVGWGPEGYRIVFGRFVDDGYVIAYGRDVITDRVHSGPLDIAVSLGAGGLIGWLLLVGGSGWLAWRRRDALSPAMTALAAGLVGYFVQQLLLFPIASLDLVAFGLLGILAAGTASAERATRRSPVVAAAASALAALAAVALASDVAADHLIAAAPPDASAAAALRPDSTRYRFIASRLEPADSEASLRRALDWIVDGRRLSPTDPALRLEEATIRTDLARLAGPGAVTAASNTLDAFLVDDPRHPQLLMQRGIVAALDGDVDAAAQFLSRAAVLAPHNVEPLLNLAAVFIEDARLDEARRVLEEAAARDPRDPRVAVLRSELDS